MRRISLSSNTNQRSISDMPEDVKDQVINEMKASTTPLFSFGGDESTDVTPCTQLLVFVTYIQPGDIKRGVSVL